MNVRDKETYGNKKKMEEQAQFIYKKIIHREELPLPTSNQTTSPP
jgi:hypothetical protein